uniref:Uncharacterized protein n=1 Tax=Anguilla anguilla TaxID=7936 RepID=A0A0E9S5Z8_ANGAN
MEKTGAVNQIQPPLRSSTRWMVLPAFIP